MGIHNLQLEIHTKYEYFPSFEYLLTHLEELKQNHDLLEGLGKDSADMVATYINLAWMKLNEYYDKLWPVAYIGAVVLHPCFGWPALQYHWEGHADATQWEEDYSTRLKKMWKEEYATRVVPGLAVLSTASSRRALSGYDAFLAQSLGKRKREHPDDRAGYPSQRRPALDEYERYIQTFTPADDKYQFSPLSWWKEHEMEYPNLSRMASDLLSLRTRLDRHTIGMAQSMRSWSREGIVLPSW